MTDDAHRPVPSFEGYESEPRGINDLMPFRVREILLVSTLYDSFILEEDGRFSDKLFSQYLELHLISPPRMTRASTGEEALALLGQRHFDLVIAMARIADMSPGTFARRSKSARHWVPVVVLGYEAGSLAQIPPEDQAFIDGAFVWKGDNRLLLALVKSIEDMVNVEHDTQLMVRVIIVVEDSPLYYSSFLPLLYSEILGQTQSLINDGLDHLDRLFRMRARPKILLARTYEEASALYKRYRRFVLGVISDVRFPRQGKPDPRAGLRLLNRIRNDAPELAFLLQSSEAEHREMAEASNCAFVDKNSPDLLLEIRAFIHTNFGFGPFVFRLPSGEAVDGASNLEEMREALGRVSETSLRYHAHRGHIANWLMARGEFPLASYLRERKIDDFDDTEAMRAHVVAVFTNFLDRQQRGRITEFSRRAHHLGRDFERLGGGSLGGKGRGVAFIYRLLVHSKLHKRYPDVRILVPRTTVICTGEFDRFMEANDLRERIASAASDAEIAELFLQSRISDEVHEDLEAFLEEVTYPLAIRSSSLLEDSQFQPFAGVYATYMLPNRAPSLRVRLRQVRRAIKLVYASTFFGGARSYMEAIQLRLEEEKMAVLIQRLIGSEHGDHFYPTFSGVAQSYNYYPIRYMDPADGIAVVALGLGRTVVEGGKALRFSPTHPQILPQMGTPDQALRNTQNDFFALDLSRPGARIVLDQGHTLVRLNLDAAEADGALEAVGATYVAAADRIYDTIHRPGARVVNFAPILKHGRFPLAPLLLELLQVAEQGMGCPVEMEFAGNLTPTSGRPELAVLQIRPLVRGQPDARADLDSVDPARIVLRSERALGHGVIDDIWDVVFVSPARFDRRRTRLIAEEVGQINAALAAQSRRYVLIGPGRWGTADPHLGVPVSWPQVSAACVIVEVAFDGFDVDPSQGTHFFHNITSLKVGYLSIGPADGERELIDWAWLAEQPAVADLTFAKHVRLQAPLLALLDGIGRRAVLVRAPAPEDPGDPGT